MLCPSFDSKKQQPMNAPHWLVALTAAVADGKATRQGDKGILGWRRCRCWAGLSQWAQCMLLSIYNNICAPIVKGQNRGSLHRYKERGKAYNVSFIMLSCGFNLSPIFGTLSQQTNCTPCHHQHCTPCAGQRHHLHCHRCAAAAPDAVQTYEPPAAAARNLE